MGTVQRGMPPATKSHGGASATDEDHPTIPPRQLFPQRELDHEHLIPHPHAAHPDIKILGTTASRFSYFHHSRSNAHHTSASVKASEQPTMSTVQEITSVEAWEQHVSSLAPSTLLIASFHAPWAAPCAQMATVLSTLASEYPVTDPLSTSWVKINAEELSDISEAYNVTAVPFLVLIRNGQVLETVSGSSATKVREAIEKHANKTTTSAATTNGPAATTTNQGGEVTAEEDPAKKKEELFKRLAELVKAAPVMLFMKGTPSEPKCGFSRQIVGILREHSVKYGFFNILADDDVRQGLKEFADWPTYPQLWINGELVGGLDIVSFALLFGLVLCTNGPPGQGGAGEQSRLPQAIQRQGQR
jgi:Grx4 family monothiol glutaredoxin